MTQFQDYIVTDNWFSITFYLKHQRKFLFRIWWLLSLGPSVRNRRLDNLLRELNLLSVWLLHVFLFRRRRQLRDSRRRFWSLSQRNIDDLSVLRVGLLLLCSQLPCLPNVLLVSDDFYRVEPEHSTFKSFSSLDHPHLILALWALFFQCTCSAKLLHRRRVWSSAWRIYRDVITFHYLWFSEKNAEQTKPF